MTNKSPSFTTWMNIQLGTGLITGNDFRESLRKVNFTVGVWGYAILSSSHFIGSRKKREVELVQVSIAELGYEYGAARRDIYERAQNLGLRLCPAEVGPYLRIQYVEQPEGEQILIAMESVFISSRTSGSFAVLGRTEYCGPALDGIDNRPEDFWNANSRWIFLRRK